MAVAADKGRLEDDPGIPVYRKGENGGPDDLGAYRVAVRVPDTGAGGEDPVWGVY